MLTAAVILYVPANVLPVMRVVSMGSEKADTILGGILYFLRTGSWPLALLIFFASIVVPLLKLAILSFLLLSVRRKSTWSPAFRTRLYHLTEIIGRWSMVDIFAVTLMVAMVEMGAVATIEPGPGAVAFAAVVMATMLASHSFDPRLLWDAMEDGHE
jgi:paraquat-inducible protein A